MKNWGSRLFFLLFYVFVVGCSAKSAPEGGSYIDIFPVTYSLSLNIKDKSALEAEKKLDQFIQRNRNVILSRPVELIWSSSKGESFKNIVVKKLVSLGVSKSKILQRKTDSKKGYFDFVITSVQWHVEPSECGYSKSEGFYSMRSECHVENMRWKSMVAPEKMLKRKRLFGEVEDRG